MINTAEYGLSDFEWECLEKILPRENFGRGRPASNTRTKVNGMLWMARTRSNWRDLPEHYDNWQTVYSKYRQWRRNGVLHKLCAELADTPEMASNGKQWQASVKTWHQLQHGTAVRSRRAGKYIPRLSINIAVYIGQLLLASGVFLYANLIY